MLNHDFREMAARRHRPNGADLRDDIGVKRCAFMVIKNHFHYDTIGQLN